MFEDIEFEFINKDLLSPYEIMKLYGISYGNFAEEVSFKYKYSIKRKLRGLFNNIRNKNNIKSNINLIEENKKEQEEIKFVEQNNVNDDEIIELFDNQKDNNNIPENNNGKKPNIFIRILSAIWKGIKFIAKCIFKVVNFIIDSLSFILRFFYFILNFLLIGGCLGVLVAIFMYAKVYPFYQEVSSTAYDKLAAIEDSDFQMEEDTKVYDNDGKVIGQINAGNYKYCKIKDVSDYVTKGYVATEDKHFFTHIGVDAQGLARALLTGYGGGSTITQQVVKNNVLTPEHSYKRKLIELLIAPRVEQMYSKAKIMEFYVNTCFYGNNCYGIETASRYYFGKHCKELSLAEAAMLCGISNSPSKYNPVASFELATEKKEHVLKRMLAENYITEKQYKKAMKQKVKLSLISHNYKTENYMTSYAIYCATIKLMEQDGFKFKYTFESAKDEEKYEKKYQKEYLKYSAIIRSGGYKIYTSFDQSLQDKLQHTIDSNLARYTETQSNGKYAMQSASVCIDNKTGFVVAMVGGRGAKDEFNRAFLSTRQPGSSIKPLLVYAPAINNGVLVPSTIYEDKSVSSPDGNYSPKNAGGGYIGAVSIREAIARSLNTVAYQIYRDTGKTNSIEYLNKMKFSSLSYADNFTEALCLGGFTNGVKIVEECKAYSTLAMGGVYTNVNCIKKFENNKDGVIFDYKDSSVDLTSEVYTEDTAFMMQDIMRGAIEEDYGTAKNIRRKDMIVSGKTGTTNSNKDLWFSGFTKAYTCTVWVGYDTPRAMIGLGSKFPAKIFSDYMSGIKANKTCGDYDKPETISLRVYSHGYKGKDLAIKKKKGVSWYDYRKDGFEWYSTQNKDTLKSKQYEIENAKNVERAKIMLEAFEKFYITNIEEAIALDDKYQEVIGAIEAIEDAYESSNFMKRAVKHYDLLNDDVIKSWNQYKDEYYADEEKQADAEAKVAAEDSKLQAYNNLKENRIARAEWYLDKLSTRKYNTDTTKLLVSDAAEIIERLSEYDEYKSYKKRYNEQVSRINELPTEIPVIRLPRDDTDTQPIENNKYPEDPDHITEYYDPEESKDDKDKDKNKDKEKETTDEEEIEDEEDWEEDEDWEDDDISN